MKPLLQGIAGLLIGILIADFLGFMIWVNSGQMPTDGYYIGEITASIIRFFR